MPVSIRVLTLNCWGVATPIACQKRHERMTAIAKELAKAEYDIIMLQEIWTQSDYEKLCAKLLTVFPYTHYFHSGVLGCGVCLFSKHPILETTLHPYTLNGYAHKVLHCDWLAGKAVGMARILVDGLKMNVYSTHLHAQYDETKDEYMAHRVVQAYELGQFVRLTSETCDAVILGGDLNMVPTDLGYALVCSNANVQDAWLTQKSEKPQDSGATCDRSDNSFTSTKLQQTTSSTGQRLDYLMYRSNAGYDMQCDKCWVTMGQIPGEKYHYSDHEGVAAIFTVKKNITALPPPRDSGAIEKHFTDALPLLDDGLRKVKADRVFYLIALILCFVTLTFTSSLDLPFGLDLAVVFVRTLLVLAAGFCVWMALVMSNKEANGLIAARKDITNLLRSNPSP